MAPLLRLLLAAFAIVLLPACASTEQEDPNRVSTIPWNRPEKWEGQGPMGGMGTQ
jgi:outer membrane biogenesis lipoprotein LolB